MRFHKLIDFIHFVYKIFLSPFLHAFSGPGAGCRFKPTCSDYMADSIKKYGLLRGGSLGLRRLCQCHPFSKAV